MFAVECCEVRSLRPLLQGQFADGLIEIRVMRAMRGQKGAARSCFNHEWQGLDELPLDTPESDSHEGRTHDKV